ncbi:hypothetical protein CO540_04805 [Micromonospora sp. WMMA2032]|uniref:hypothetical protein n=1 Tax=Micromonospora sp. WMMA2032 TaxID=2039870 RepID=UPI000C05A2D6|nr:hypothetical protein [Micromonospora sp. WMMA2032]ATO13230.1 hypothetical protein CO540_04805 [Micromonospora sp. WMMA2032]
MWPAGVLADQERAPDRLDSFGGPLRYLGEWLAQEDRLEADTLSRRAEADGAFGDGNPVEDVGDPIDALHL